MKALAETKPDPTLFEEPYRDKKGKKIMPKYTMSNLGAHHLFQLLDYNPQAIKTAALIWRGHDHMSLVKLY